MFFKFEQGSLYYEIYGQNNKATLVFFHGVAMNHETFEFQIIELEKYYQVIVIDLPNHGQSSHLDTDIPYSKKCADIAVSLLNHLKIDKAILVGQSLGSFIVQHIAHSYPKKVIATIHIGGAGLYPKSSFFLKSLIPFIKPLITLIPSKQMFTMFAEHKALQEHTKKYLKKVSTQTGKNVIVHITKDMLRDMVEGIPTPIQQPTLIIFGDHEASFVKKMSIKFNDTLKNSNLIIIKDAHHIANQDNSTEFNRELIAFSEEVIKQNKNINTRQQL
ncbi:MAG: alpha/beta fold hydrolase [Anaerobacillus sp.]|uniref:alpha/beta fold hydrolase n=1 Tax=Anaerobacillus sp. TaxID=1872506 RepID=UPI00391B2023